MMKALHYFRRHRIFRNQRGAAVIEMAFALPVLIVMMWMIIQLGLVFRAMSGIQHGLGEGARMATLYSPDSLSARKINIKKKIEDTVYGIGPGNFTISPVTNGVQSGANYMDLKVSYSQATDLLLFPGPTINVARSKRVWIAI